MITPAELQNRAVLAEPITARQREVLQLVQAYYAVALELPSTGWISRRLNISRQRAHALMERLREIPKSTR